jgi:hypothetical protein
MTNNTINLDGYNVTLGGVRMHGVTTVINEDKFKVWEIHSASQFPDFLGFVRSDLDDGSGDDAQVKIFLSVGLDTENGDDERANENTIVALPLHDQEDGWHVIADMINYTVRVAAYKR